MNKPLSSLGAGTHSLLDLLSTIVDNRGRTCPVQDVGIPLIATNCIANDGLYVKYDTQRYVSDQTYGKWFRAHPEPGDLIFVLKGSPGRVCVAGNPVDFCIAQDMVALRPDPNKVYPKFLFALLRTKKVQRQIQQMHVGTLIPHFKKGDFGKLMLDLPPPQIQRFVGDLYYLLSEKVELNRNIFVTLEDAARALFKSWFVDFDPVRAKAEGRDTCLAPDIAAMFPDSFAMSKMGEIPKGWTPTRVGDCAKLDKGLSYKGQYLSEDGMPMINLACFSGNGIFDADRVKGYSGEYKLRHLVKNGDLVIANTDITQKRLVLGSPGIVNLPPGAAEALFSHHTYALRVLDDSASMREFLYHTLLQDEFRHRAMGYATGTTVLALPSDAILEHQFVLPTGGILEAFSVLNGKLRARQRNAAREMGTLKSIRDALLPKVISGELQVIDPERVLAASA